MNFKKLLYTLLLMLVFPAISFAQSVYTVEDVYTNPDLHEGDSIILAAYYSDTTANLLVQSYTDYLLNQPMPPNSILVLEDLVPPESAWNGGFVVARGTIRFEERTDNYNPEDTRIAYLSAYDISVVVTGMESTYVPELPSDNNDYAEVPCDTCKFAILISGGIDNWNNHSKYWKSIVALYEYKTERERYCKDNVFVHYYKGVRKTNDIPSASVKKADSTSLAASFKEIAERVAKCTKAGQKATFQKMVANHGVKTGDINLLGKGNFLKPSLLRDWQQTIIDSCCTTIYDEFLQCYAGYDVDTIANLDTKNKTKVYINSSADKQVSASAPNEVDSYLKGKIDALKAGKSYEDAVLAGKLAYDIQLGKWRDEEHKKADSFRQKTDSLKLVNTINELLIQLYELEITKRKNDSALYNGLICKSKNITITPMERYCQWHKYVLPPGGQLILKFKGDSTNCGNVTVYKEQADKSKEKVKVWNWNVKGSLKWKAGYSTRVINGATTNSTTFWVHNDSEEFKITGEVTGNTSLPESPSNKEEFPGFSVGGSDTVSIEFGEITEEKFKFEDVDSIGVILKNLPRYMGPEYVTEMDITFTVNPLDTLWNNMELYFEIIDLVTPGMFIITAEGAENGYIEMLIEEPGIYSAFLGDLGEMQYDGKGHIRLASPEAQFAFDCWGLRISTNTSSVPGMSKDNNKELLKLAPNPFGSGTMIEYNIPRSGEVRLLIYDLSGKVISDLKNEHHQSGVYHTYFDSSQIPDGFYIL
ncbi:MAG: T9SS type A sorting domain-containing protein, partial [Bacteroidetes bacterium]|nr:T9SS type A sorting domain-containing protein [Bacteroidota bacterium]